MLHNEKPDATRADQVKRVVGDWASTVFGIAVAVVALVMLAH